MSEYVISRREGRMQHIVLDRPKALNSLDLPMCRALHTALDEAAQDPGVEAVVTTSTSEKAFCAGGDIRALRDAAASGDHAANREFFSEEYEMDLAYHTHRVPTVAVIHGVAMGGGLGISINGSHRVVTKKVMMAMPETAIVHPRRRREPLPAAPVRRRRARPGGGDLPGHDGRADELR